MSRQASPLSWQSKALNPTGVATFLVTPLQTTAVSLNKTTTTIANPGLEFSAATVSNSATREGELWTVVHNGDSGTATTDDTDPTIDEVIADLTTPFSVTSVSVETNGGGTTAPQSSFAQRVTVITPVFRPGDRPRVEGTGDLDRDARRRLISRRC